ncbi:hypothetical protein [Vibrio pectenicida]|uniref:Uncharacterized protein n=1 Tax=Vibrio pectenicida TaxID=62763 RepID=A0A427U3W6_9VIBR|nr:hypothetical protein [Vibrio pectenicida]RSD31287.1 hypothetical protein EJA03_09450 [Vibrio pectenicida]
MLSFDLSLIPEVDDFFSSVHKYTVEEFGGTYTAFYHESQKEISGTRREHNIDYGLSFANLKYNFITGLNFSSFSQNKIFTQDILNDFKTITDIRNEIFRYTSLYNIMMHRDNINICDVITYSKNIISPSIRFLQEANQSPIYY